MGGTNDPKAAPGLNRWALLRYERGATIAEVAAGARISVRTIMRLEAEGKSPNARTAKALADFYGMSVADLLTAPEREAA